MDPHAASEELPALYRAVLDRVGQLEMSGDRVAARAIRAEAIRIYSRAWDEKAKRRLEDLLRRSAVDLVAFRAPRRGLRRFTTRRRSVVAG